MTAPARFTLGQRLSQAWGPLPAWAWLVVAGTALVLYGFNLAGARALTEHEIYVAGVAKQMDASGDYLLPRVGDRLWLEKPPLPHWLAIGVSRVWGAFDEATVRLPSVVAGLAVVLGVAWLAAHWYGPLAGLLAGLMQASTVYMITYARLAEADMLLCAIVVGALVAFVRAQPVLNGAGAPRGALLTFWALLGLTNMAKGPLFGAVVVVVVVGAWLVSRRDLAGLLRLWSPAGIAMASAIALAWPTAVLYREPAAWGLWSDHLFGRATGEVSFNEKPFWYYATCWPWQLLPWTPLVLLAAPATLRKAWHDRDAPERFLWCWALVPTLVLSLSRGKHHHYLIYALPALAPVAAVGAIDFCRRLRAGSAWARHWSNTCVRILAPAVLVAGTIVAWRAAPFRVDALFVAGVVAALCVTAALLVRRGRALASLVTTIAVVVVLEIYAHGRVLPRRDPSAADRAFLTAVDQYVPRGERLVACGGSEIARHIFYVERDVEGFWDPSQVTIAPGAKPFFVITRARYQGQLAALGRVAQVTQSAYTRREASAADRYTLYLVAPTQVAATPRSATP